jgi:RNA polymerase sigma-70 factor, ECF subfamily
MPLSGLADFAAPLRADQIAMTAAPAIAGGPVGFLSSGAQRFGRSGHNLSVTREERFRAAFDEHYRAVARFVRTRGHGSAEAEDILAATFEVAWKQMHKLPEGRGALPWLLATARNVSRNAQRKSKREASFVGELSAVTMPWTEMPIENRAASAAVVSALAQLGPLDREIILLVAWDELTPAEAGEVLGLRPVTARSRLHRARQRISALLQESEPPASRSHADPPARSVCPQEDGRAR